MSITLGNWRFRAFAIPWRYCLGVEASITLPQRDEMGCYGELTLCLSVVRFVVEYYRP